MSKKKEKVFKVSTVMMFTNVYYVSAANADVAQAAVEQCKVEQDDFQQEYIGERVVFVAEANDKLRTVKGLEGPVLVKHTKA